ncbi:MAG: hypothetical protein IKS45_08530, partial [Thermoguttaceae bacterium]|nr:hypothetical protein [Thermoguttaceae bacterium]
MSEETFTLPNNESILSLFGACDKYVRRIEDALGVKIWSDRGQIHVSGNESQVKQATSVLKSMASKAELTDDDVACCINAAEGAIGVSPESESGLFSSPIVPRIEIQDEVNPSDVKTLEV